MEELFYHEKGLFLQKLHPAASLAYICTLLVLTLIFTNPFYLAGLFFCTGLSVWMLEGLETWELFLKGGLFMTVPIMIINPLVSKAGATILWRGPSLPVFGEITVSMEAVFYGAVMSLRLLDVISIFCLYNIMVHPDKAMNMLERFAFKSALVLSLATRMFPAMIRHLENIKEIQLVRGVDFSGGTFKQKINKYTNLIYILLLSSLEDSMEIAEAMHARAFGSGRRTRYVRDSIKPADSVCLAAAAAALLTGAWGTVKGYGVMNFYPRLGPAYSRGDMRMLALLLSMLSIPSLLSWGWRYCRYFR
ncbi:MAG: energy-coupling factor transporter transmembrane protein EcfT [Tepidanaerobacteraceae bacterium]|nr:energy-coupling factor transporter transmembrane protein EcfT [Tepidanaerobacteraceae bacterium]